MPTFLDTENWMSYLKKDVRIVDTVIPASHDASAYPTLELADSDMMVNVWVGAVTQVADYAAQLNAGIRYFDMRVTLQDGVLRMKHSSFKFEKFESVLGQIKSFSAAHPGEYIFLDLNPDNLDIAVKTVAAIIAVLADNDLALAQKKFASAHLKTEAGIKKFNPDITWSGLGDARIVITLALDDAPAEKRATDASVPGTLWYHLNSLINSYSFLSVACDFRTSPFGPKMPPGMPDFGPSYWTPDQIEYFLYCQLRDWKKPSMMISQLINTPMLSPVPGDSATACDLRFVNHADRWIRVVLGLESGPPTTPDINNHYKQTNVSHANWIPGAESDPTWKSLVQPTTTPLFSADASRKWQGPRPNVVFRDMVNAGYNRASIHKLIRANSFTSSPDINVVDEVKKRTIARFRVDGHSARGQSSYLCVDPQTNEMKLTTDWWDPSCKFLLLGYEPTDGQALVYSGTDSDYTIQDKRAFRMVSPPKDPVANNDAKCMTIAHHDNQIGKVGGQVYWGMTWGESQDRETFACLDPENIQNRGSIYFGGRVVIRSMKGAAKNEAQEFWKKFTTEEFPVILEGIATWLLTPIALTAGIGVGLLAGPVGSIVMGVGAVTALWVAAAKTMDAHSQALKMLQDNKALTFLQANGGRVFATSPGWPLATTFVVEHEVPGDYVKPVAKPLRGVIDKPVASGSGTVAVADSADTTKKLGWVVLGAGTKYSWSTESGQLFVFPDAPPPDAASVVSGRKVSVDWGPLGSTGYATALSVAIVNPDVGPSVSGVVAKTVQSGTGTLVVANPDTKKAFAWLALGSGTKYSWITDSGQPFVFPGTPTPDAMSLVSGHKVRVQWAPLAPSGVATAQSVAIVVPYIGPSVSGVVGEAATSATDSFIVVDSVTKASSGPILLTSGTKLTWMTPQGVDMGLPPIDFNELQVTRQVRVGVLQWPGKPKVAMSVSIAYPKPIGPTLFGIIAKIGPAPEPMVIYMLTAEEFEKIRLVQSPTSGLSISTAGRTLTPIALSDYTTFSYALGASGRPPTEGSGLTRNVLQALLPVMVDWVQTPTSKLAYSVRIIDNRIAPSA